MILGLFLGIFFMYAVIVFGAKVEDEEKEE